VDRSLTIVDFQSTVFKPSAYSRGLFNFIYRRGG
jgi:hypothetical protein